MARTSKSMDLYRPHHPGEMWFALRCTYQREFIAQAALSSIGVVSYVPCKKIRKKTGGKNVEKPQALVHNLLFALATREQIQEIKTFRIPYLRYIMRPIPKSEFFEPIIVPQKQMESFILATSAKADIEILSLDEQLKLNVGSTVRILSGPFKGVTGKYVEYEPNENHVIVQIEGIIAIATAALTPNQIEAVEEGK